MTTSSASLQAAPGDLLLVRLHAVLAPVPAVCFVQALVTDVVYVRTDDMLWADMSAWALTGGLLVALLAVATGLAVFFGQSSVRGLRGAWVYGFSSAALLVAAILNAFVHSRDAYASVAPTGLVLSVVTVLLMLVAIWSGLNLAHDLPRERPA